MFKFQLPEILAQWSRGQISANNLHVILLDHDDEETASRILALLYELFDGAFTKTEFFQKAFDVTQAATKVQIRINGELPRNEAVLNATYGNIGTAAEVIRIPTLTLL